MATDLNALASCNWDVAVIGAGPAGSIAAMTAARRGLSVLLIDKEDFPRSKICGCCVNKAAATLLSRLGVLPWDSFVPLTEFRLKIAGREAAIALPGGFTMSRARLDALLADAAVREGAVFASGCAAIIDESNHDGRWIQLRRGGDHARVKARLVIGAAGIAGVRFADSRELPYRNAPHSRIGAGAVLPPSAARDLVGANGPLRPGIISMNCALAGYVGLVTLEDGALNLAAAIDPDFVRAKGGLGPAAAAILKKAGTELPAEVADLTWRGTPPLTRRPIYPCAERVIVVGDACGYVEPFTGEGIAWAIEQGAVAGNLAARAAFACFESIEPEWRRATQIFAARRMPCRMLASMLRFPTVTRGVVRALEHAPDLARPVLARLNREPF